MSVCVINQRNEPLMPCSEQKARKLLKQNNGYFACSIGNASKETIENYIQSQG